jgi:hypothetical protein
MVGGGSVGLERKVRVTLNLARLHAQRVPEKRKVDGGGSEERDQRAAQREMVEDETGEHGDFRFLIFDF